MRDRVRLFAPRVAYVRVRIADRRPHYGITSRIGILFRSDRLRFAEFNFLLKGFSERERCLWV